MHKMATREAYGLALNEIVKMDKKIVVLDADLSGATRTTYVKQNFPQQFYNVGIAEANMVTMAAGLAVSDLKPFVNTFAMFMAGRAFEQIRNSIAYPNLNVKLCASHAGISVGEDGATHQCNEDIALMRVLPNMVVLQPSDAIETKEMVNFMANYDGPCYMRTSRMATEIVNQENYIFQLGKIVELIKGKDVVLLASGIMVSEAKKAIVELNKKGVYPALYNLPTIKPIDKKQVLDVVGKYEYVLVLEEHSIIGGIYSMLCEIVNGEKRLIPIAIKDIFSESGTPSELMSKYKIDAEEIVKVVCELIK